MNKKFIYYGIAVIVIGSLPKTAQLLRTHFAPKESPRVCEVDKKVCPDDTTVVRVLPDCDFAMCPVPTNPILPLTNEVATTTELATTTTFIATTTKVKVTSPKLIEKPVKKVTIVSKITSAVASAIKTITAPFTSNSFASSNPKDASIPASSYITTTESNNSQTSPTLPPAEFAGQKYIVKDNTILSNDNKVVYTIPPEVLEAVGSSNAGWTNTTINVIPVGTTPPIPPGNAIPITDLPGKYYLSENSFGNIAACEFSNKIFILDTIANTVTLLYEENNTTLSPDDPRACNSEIFLLTTDNEKLALKYHTIGTNTLCDSAWSEPEKTFFLDVTKLSTEGMKKYTIPENLSANAEQEEEACRGGL